MDRTIRAGEIIGEMGVFSPLKERTASAVCTTDSTFLILGERTALDPGGEAVRVVGPDRPKMAAPAGCASPDGICASWLVTHP